MTPWRWFVGHYDSVEYEDIYDIGDCATREEAVAAGLRETQPGEHFYIIEARSSTAAEHEGADMIPFLRFKNRELLTNGPTGAVAAE